MLPTLPYVFANGTAEVNIIDAPKVNANFDELAEVLTGNIEKDNIKTGSAICLKDTVATIAAIWTFSSNPVFNAAGISDAALSANVPLKNAANTFSAKQTLGAGIDFQKTQAENMVVHKVASLPSGVSADIGRIIYCTGDNKFYGWNGTSWQQMDYVGGYTGGAVRTLSDFGIVDDGNGYKLWFKTEGATPTVKIAIKGEPYPSRFYTELGYHAHSFTGAAHTHSVTDPTHSHSTVMGSHDHGAAQYGLSTHTHGIAGNTGGASADHTHTVSGTSGAGGTHVHGISITSAGYDDTHYHWLELTTGDQSVTHTHAVFGSTSSVNVGTGAQPHAHAIDFASGNASAGHTHYYAGYTDYRGGTHTHGVSGNTGSITDHTHTFSATSSGRSVDHSHAFSFTSGASSANQAVPSTDLGTKGSTAVGTGVSIQNATQGGTVGSSGVNGGTLSSAVKLYGNALTVKIDGTNVTSNVLTATGWAAVGDGTGTHALHTAGTGEMDASAWKSYSAGYHTLEVLETVSGYGCSLLILIETS